MDALIERFGFAGYGRWFRILETIGSKMDESDRCHVEYSIRKWCEILRMRPQQLSNFCAELEQIMNKNCASSAQVQLTLDSKTLQVRIPNMLKIRDEYSKKSGQNPDKLPPKKKKQSKEADTEDTPNRVSKARTALASSFVSVWNLEKLDSWPVVNFDTMKAGPKKTLTDRLWVASKNEDFDLKQIISKASEVQFLQTGRFFNLLWLVTHNPKYNELNYKQVLNGTYTNNRPSPIGKQRAGHLTPTGLDF